MSDDWKWVLRSSIATRPVMRAFPGIDISNPSDRHESAAFTDTRGIFKVSAGDQDSSAAFGQQPDLGTAFALATSLFGTHELQLSGNVGYANSGLPTAGFRTTFSRTGEHAAYAFTSPEVQLTMRQVFLPARAGGAFLNGDAAARSAPALRSMTAAVHDKAALGDDVTLEYGFSLDSVAFIERLNYFSPYARLNYGLGDFGSLRFAYSSGAPPAELILDSEGSQTDLQQDLATLALFPRISLRDGRAKVQRSENFEAGFTKVIGSRTFQVSLFREAVRNAALTMAGADGLIPTADLLPDIASTSSVFNVGSFNSNGYAASVTQSFNDHLSGMFAFGNGGVLRTEQRELQTGSPDELRAMVKMSQRNWASARIFGVLPSTGTAAAASYLWTDYRSLTPAHAFLTQNFTPQAGLNVSVRQPIPMFGGIPGRLEATAELRNLLAQGYLPVQGAGGRRLLLIHSPRAVRGGLSFIF